MKTLDTKAICTLISDLINYSIVYKGPLPEVTCETSESSSYLSYKFFATYEGEKIFLTSLSIYTGGDEEYNDEALTEDIQELFRTLPSDIVTLSNKIKDIETSNFAKSFLKTKDPISFIDTPTVEKAKLIGKVSLTKGRFHATVKATSKFEALSFITEFFDNDDNIIFIRNSEQIDTDLFKVEFN